MKKNKYHTIVVSDLHLSDAEPEYPERPLWKKFRQEKFFIDQDFAEFLAEVDRTIPGPIELVLNGDIFDFDSVMSLPKNNEFKYKSHEKKRGLGSEEHKSVFKLKRILEDHHVWLQALSNFLHSDNKIIFTIGNHDIELHWPKAQNLLIEMMDLPEGKAESVVFCEWFYLSEEDTLIEHGNQYDPYCLCANPINPLVQKGKKEIVRLPFGNLANKYMVNGMGLKNPHTDNTFVMSVWGFIHYFFKYEVKVQPFLIWVWFTGALRTLVVYTKEGWLPALKDPLTLDEKIEKMAVKAQTTPKILRILREYHAHPAAYRPFMVLRELWLDRALFFMIILAGSFQFFSTTNLLMDVSAWWFVVPFFISFLFFTKYAMGVSSDVRAHAKEAENRIPDVAFALNVGRVIQGHTHNASHRAVSGVEFLNTGSWTRLFYDVECTKPYGRKPFALITPHEDGTRTALLYEWKDGEFELISDKLGRGSLIPKKKSA